jgi:hypothetical protein
VEGPLPHGIVYSVGSAGTTAPPDYGGLPYAFTGASVPTGTVARISASGDLNLTENPDCDWVFWGDVTTPIPPSGLALNMGKVDVNRATSLDNPTNWGGSNPNEFVTYMTNGDSTPAQIMASRQGIPGGCFTSGGDPTFDFYISGATTLTIDILGVNVTASPTNVQPGEIIQFSAAPINFVRAAEISWTFDTLAYEPQIDVVTCNNQPVCSYAPPKSGRMQVCMYDEHSFPICDESQQIVVTPWINGAPPCRAKVASYTRISLAYADTDAYHKDPHMGQDYSTPTGTPVISADSGTVIYADWAGSSGFAVAVRSAKPDSRGLILDTYYYHLKENSILVQYHQSVLAGQQLALSDDSGKWPDQTASSHGSHVHIEQHTPTPGKEAFPVKDIHGHYHNDRKTAVVPCTF